MRKLRGLRVTEVSLVDKGANPHAKIRIAKRDDDAAAEFAKARSRPHARHGGGSLSGKGDGNLDLAEAKHRLLHTAEGRSIRRDFPSETVDELANHLIEAAQLPTRKSEEDKPMSLTKRLEHIPEATVTEAIMDYARTQKRAGESDQAAFTRVFTAPTSEGAALRRAHEISKRAGWRAAAPPLNRTYTDEQAIAVGKRMADAERRPSWLRF
jgi:hypothetical protein